jgi:glycosyltransferase involved in cell wall biosynthesis
MVEPERGVRYRFIPSIPNKIWLDIANRLARFMPSKRPSYARTIYHLDYILQVALDLRRQGCDIVHLHNFSQFAPVIRFFNPKIKIVLHMHCEWLSQLDQAMIVGRMRQCDLVVGCSEYITEKIRSRFPEYARVCRTVYNGVDPDVFRCASRPEAGGEGASKSILFVGRISPEKGVHVLLEAFGRVLGCYPNAKLSLAGPIASAPVDFIVGLSEEKEIAGLAAYYQGNYFDQLRGLITPEMDGEVEFLGPVPHAELVEYYCRADVLVNPSFSEAFGMSLVEAMAAQTPVVATRAGGMPEVIEDGKTGLLTPPGDAQALAEAILKLLSEDGSRKMMGEAGRRRAQELYTWQSVTETLSSHYEQIM